MALFNKNPNEAAYVGGKKHWTDVIKNSGSGELRLEKIDSFSGQYRFLSNFYRCQIKSWDGITYPTVEHAFQASKTLDMEERRKIAGLTSPGEAKRAGKALKLRSDWSVVKVRIMLDLLRIKFQTPDLKRKLLSTGNAKLIEGNTWGDRFWGQCYGTGENMLGKLLMKVRSELRNAEIKK